MLLLRLSIFFKSLIFHIWAGFPKASKEQIYARYHICSCCEYFDEIKSVCNVCGCNLTKKKEFLNKLAWADQECPKGKWKKIGDKNDYKN